MANQFMTVYYPQADRTKEGLPAYHFKDSIATAGNGDWVLIPAGIAHISVILEVTSGGGKIQVTNDYEGVVAGSANGIIDWDEGDVTATAQSQIAPVVAVRQVNASGTTKMFLQVQ